MKYIEKIQKLKKNCKYFNTDSTKLNNTQNNIQKRFHNDYTCIDIGRYKL